MIARLLFALVTLAVSAAEAKTVSYELVATKEKVNLSGKKEVDFAIAINGSIPAPTLEFTEGDEALITVVNRIPDDEVSIHWHGILLPPEMDGVPYLTTPPIHPGESHTFHFTIRQSGTYWYHSHTNVQEQKGVYGAFIIHPREPKIVADKEAVVVLSDWSDENATQILKNLRKDGDYYLYKKGTVRSLGGAMRAGSLGGYLHNEWIRMGGMDYSDVGYDAFLVNGKRDPQLSVAKAGEKIRVRIINASASTYFYVAMGNLPMRVISADGVDIEPTSAKEILMGMAETYDVLFELPEAKNFELKATAQDGTGSASAWIGEGEKVFAPVRPRPPIYGRMDHSSHHHDHSKMMMHDSTPTVLETLTVDNLQAKASTVFREDAPVKELRLVLGGDMNRYIWYINGKTIHEDRTIDVKDGEVVRFIFENQTMMHHPMHLHGHFFRVVNQYGDRSPLKHTVDVPPHGSRTIEFLAQEPGEWMLHCHNLYHLKNGMARVVKYMSYTPRPELAAHQKHDPHHHDHWYSYGAIEATSNHGQAEFRLFQTRNEWVARVETRKDDEWGLEADVLYRRWFTPNFSLTGGYTTFAENHRGAAGFRYRLPMLVETMFLLDHTAHVRIDAAKRFQWTKHFFSDAELTWRQEEGIDYEVSLMFSADWGVALGVKFTGESFGGGVQFQF